MPQYTTAGLDRLYQAIKQQAEDEFLEALHRDYPEISSQEKTELLATYHQLEREAEQRVIAHALEQSRGKK